MNQTAYLDYWRLEQKPFLNTPDPKFFFRSEQHQEALSRLLLTVMEQYGGALLVGTYGCGKTALLNVLRNELKNVRHQFAIISNPPTSYPSLLRGIVRQLKGGEPLPQEATEASVDYLLEKLEEILRDNANDRTETIVVIDEAHTLTEASTLDGLRRLLNFQQADRFLLTLILSGQPELESLVTRNKPLAQRIAMTAHLNPLPLADTKKYVEYRLEQAGATQSIFTDSAMTLLHQRSGGIPRRINHLAELSLLLGAHQQLTQLDSPFIKNDVFEQEETATK